MDVGSYGAAMQKIVPGSFVPDIAPVQAPKSEPLDEGADGLTGSPTGSFGDTLKGFLNDVNDKQVAADQGTEDMALGKTNDSEGVIKSVEEASLAMEYTIAIQNKLLQDYQSLQQMQV